nr:glycosyltransferase [Rhodopirellula sp. SM50]
MDQQQRRWFSELVEREKYQAVWISKAATAMCLGWHDPRKTVLDGDDFDSVREYFLLRNSPWYGAKAANYLNVIKLKAWEYYLPSRFAYLARCSEADRRRVPRHNVVVIPNGTEIPASAPSKEFYGPPRVLFVGSLGYQPNAQGLDWFLQLVWPLIRQDCPEATLDIVGGGADPATYNAYSQHGVRAHGFVEDLQPFWQSASVSIAPLLAGGGTRLKIIESLAQMTPVVTTTIGAYGLDLTRDQGVFCENSPVKYAEQVSRLLTNREHAEARTRVGFTEVSDKYDWDSIRRKMQELVKKVAAH